jgi:hypothetical protein
MQVGIKVTNSLGSAVGLQGCRVNFLLQPEKGLKLDVAEPTCGAGGVLFYPITLQEAEDVADVSRVIKASLQEAEGGRFLPCSDSITLSYIPQSVALHNAQSLRNLTQKINQLEGERARIEAAQQAWERERLVLQTAANERREARDRCRFSVEDEALLNQVRRRLDEASVDVPCRLLPPVDSVVARFQQAGTGYRLAYELGRVLCERDSAAINALAAAKLVAAVTNTEAEKEVMVRSSRFKGLMVVSLASCASPRRPAGPPPANARYAVDLVRPVEERFRTLWQDMLGDALVFTSEDALAEYKERCGFCRQMTALRQDGTWRTVRGKWEVAGRTERATAHLGLVPFAETAEGVDLIRRRDDLLTRQR